MVEEHHEPIVIEPGQPADSAVILLHGLGADGHDFESLAPEMRLPASAAIRWVFPNAPVRAVTINDGYMMRAWYDISNLDLSRAEDEPGIRESAAAVGDLIRGQRAKGIAAHRIVLGGFSQGGAMALFTALRWPERLGGIAALSCYLPLSVSLAAEAHPANSGLPVFMAHGAMDQIVPFSLAEGSRDILRARGYAVSWKTWPMQHTICADEIQALGAWLLETLAPRRRNGVTG